MSLPTIKKILYTTSLGPYTRPVYRHAVQMAAANNAELLMLYITTPVGELGQALIDQYLPKELVSKVRNEGVDSVLQQMQQRVELFYNEELQALDHPPHINVTPMVRQGLHHEAILKTAEEEQVDMIVMGTENRVGLHSQSHTTQQVIKSARVPVHVVPTGKDYLNS